MHLKPQFAIAVSAFQQCGFHSQRTGFFSWSMACMHTTCDQEIGWYPTCNLPSGLDPFTMLALWQHQVAVTLSSLACDSSQICVTPLHLALGIAFQDIFADTAGSTLARSCFTLSTAPPMPCHAHVRRQSFNLLLLLIILSTLGAADTHSDRISRQ